MTLVVRRVYSPTRVPAQLRLMQIPSSPFRARLFAHKIGGFSLIEVAVVITVVSVLLVIIAAPLSGQLERRRIEETQKILETARDALYGYAAANGRLPCPATASSAGQEAPIGGGACTAAVGFLPAVTLGLTPVDSAGYLVDAWADGTAARRIRYAVSTSNGSAVTTVDGIRNATMASVGSSTSHLYVCATGLAAAPPTTNCGATVVTLADRAPAVLYSLGKDTATNSFDETNNQNGDVVFTSGNPNPTFDDQVIWLSLNTLFSRMISGQKLP